MPDEWSIWRGSLLQAEAPVFLLAGVLVWLLHVSAEYFNLLPLTYSL